MTFEIILFLIVFLIVATLISYHYKKNKEFYSLEKTFSKKRKQLPKNKLAHYEIFYKMYKIVRFNSEKEFHYAQIKKQLVFNSENIQIDKPLFKSINDFYLVILKHSPKLLFDHLNTTNLNFNHVEYFDNLFFNHNKLSAKISLIQFFKIIEKGRYLALTDKTSSLLLLAVLDESNLLIFEENKTKPEKKDFWLTLLNLPVNLIASTNIMTTKVSALLHEQADNERVEYIYEFFDNIELKPATKHIQTILKNSKSLSFIKKKE